MAEAMFDLSFWFRGFFGFAGPLPWRRQAGPVVAPPANMALSPAWTAGLRGLPFKFGLGARTRGRSAPSPHATTPSTASSPAARPPTRPPATSAAAREPIQGHVFLWGQGLGL